MQRDVSAFDGKAFVRNLSTSPGVYRFYDAAGMLLYVGKAGSLKKRVGSYFLRPRMEPRIAAMVAQIAHAQVTLTRTASEALLLESQLIKAQKPRYNILLRDDKSFPWIYLSDKDEYPRLSLQRGPRTLPGSYFGPYPSAHAVRVSLNLMQKLFKIRQCEDSYFGNRSRPCLQFQIGRCSAPCVRLIGVQDYRRDVRHLRMFLEGRSSQVIDELVEGMEQASASLDFERAARLRDQVSALRSLQAQHHVRGAHADMDVLACRLEAGVACVSVLFFRNGINLGSRDYFPRLALRTDAAEVLAQFMAQYYLEQPAPVELLCHLPVAEAELLSEAMSTHAGHAVTLKTRVRGERARFLALAERNANAALDSRLAGKQSLTKRFADLTTLLKMETSPRLIECFDISHTGGEATVASCVVFGPEGAIKSHYRRFNIEDITPGDDYAAMHEALSRRYRRLAQGQGECPDLLLIDGGKGQVRQAQSVLDGLGITGIMIVGVAKGPARRSGDETLVLAADRKTLHPGPHSAALHLIDAVRDEAHRFAIAGHRKRRAKTRQRSTLEEIAGIGRQRCVTLLRAFGGLQGLNAAGTEELAMIKGVSRTLAERIYAHLHP